MENHLLPSSLQVPEQAENEIEVPGPRKLVRPRLAEKLPGKQLESRRPPAPVAPTYHASHAEVFYFQKQMQAQTPLVFVLDDGERIEGIIEWYDLNAVKVRHLTRTLIYKSSIKYIYKAGETQGSALYP
jgi:sRNA-binding regulator protein Hfq